MIRNVPRIRDVDSMLDAARGPRRQGRVDRRQRGPPAGRRRQRAHEVDEGPASRIRASFLAAGPLLARFGEAKMPAARAATRSAAAASTPTSTPSATSARKVGGERLDRARRRRPTACKATRIFMDEPSVMGTENALLAAALTPGPTTIANAASEPHVQDLARLLDARWAREVDGIGSNVMTVQRPRQARRRRARRLPRPHRDRQLHGAGRRHRRRAAHPRHRPRGPRGDPAPLPPPRPAVDGRGPRRPRAARAEADDPRRPGRRDPEDRRRPLAGLPRRPHLDRAGARHAGRRARS